MKRDLEMLANQNQNYMMNENSNLDKDSILFEQIYSDNLSQFSNEKYQKNLDLGLFRNNSMDFYNQQCIDNDILVQVNQITDDSQYIIEQKQQFSFNFFMKLEYFNNENSQHKNDIDIEMSLQMQDKDEAKENQNQILVQIEQQQQNHQNKQIIKKNKKIFKAKNCCKYIILNALRIIDNPQYRKIIKQICQKNNVEPSKFIQFYSGSINVLTGFRALRNETMLNGTDQLVDQRKQSFRDYLKWYLINMATNHIIRGKIHKQNKLLYLQYKNQVLQRYINCPEQWISDQIIKINNSFS